MSAFSLGTPAGPQAICRVTGRGCVTVGTAPAIPGWPAPPREVLFALTQVPVQQVNVVHLRSLQSELTSHSQINAQSLPRDRALRLRPWEGRGCIRVLLADGWGWGKLPQVIHLGFLGAFRSHSCFKEESMTLRAVQKVSSRVMWKAEASMVGFFPRSPHITIHEKGLVRGSFCWENSPQQKLNWFMPPRCFKKKLLEVS